MRLFTQLITAGCVLALFVTPVSAYLFPYNGWWGAGYYGGYGYANYPSYTSYYAGYPSYTSYYAAPSSGCCGAAAPVYAASYGSACGSGCCVSSCCDPCGSSGSCGAGCASGSCAGSVPSQSLKAVQDPISSQPEKSYEEENPRRSSPGQLERKRPVEDEFPPPVEPDRKDGFSSSPKGTTFGSEPSSGRGSFQENTEPGFDQIGNKPQFSDPLDGGLLDPANGGAPKANDEPGNPVDPKTFFDGSGTDRDNSAARRRDAVIARSSSLNEVIAPQRLASRSLPAMSATHSNGKLATSSDANDAETQRPARWISAPLPVGNVRL